VTGRDTRDKTPCCLRGERGAPKRATQVDNPTALFVGVDRPARRTGPTYSHGVHGQYPVLSLCLPLSRDPRDPPHRPLASLTLVPVASLVCQSGGRSRTSSVSPDEITYLSLPNRANVAAKSLPTLYASSLRGPWVKKQWLEGDVSTGLTRANAAELRSKKRGKSGNREKQKNYSELNLSARSFFFVFSCKKNLLKRRLGRSSSSRPHESAVRS